MTQEVHARPVVRVAQDLTRIVELAAALEAQAIAKANDRLMPGGLAMVALAHIASIETYTNRLDGAERRALANGAPLPDIEDDDTWEPPLQTLLYWSEQLRRDDDADLNGRRPTYTSEANYIRYKLDWLWDNEPRWDDFATDIHTARTRLENLLSDGDRDMISEGVTCLACGTRLRRRMTTTGFDDEWWCRDCGKHLTRGQYNLALSDMLRRELLGDAGDE